MHGDLQPTEFSGSWKQLGRRLKRSKAALRPRVCFLRTVESRAGATTAARVVQGSRVGSSRELGKRRGAW